MSNPTKLFRPSEYLTPASIAETLKLMSRHGHRGWLIAGGTDLMVEKEPQVEVFIDITGLGLNYIQTDSQGVRIGAVTTFADIEASPTLQKSPYTALAEAAHQVGTPQIRNMATIGGNICHAVPSADSAPALLVLDATLGIACSAGERTVKITDFFQGVRQDALENCEFVTEVRLPILPAHTGTVFAKKGRVAAADLAVVNTAIRITMDGSNCQEVRIALGAVAPVPLRAKDAEAMLQGQEPKEELLKQVATQATQEIKPISDVRSSADYRTILSQVMVERALKEAVARARA